MLNSLPSERSSLVGRGNELSELLRAVQAHRIVTVVGPGGIGKTRLVVALAHGLAEREERVGVVELAEVIDPTRVLDAIADQLSVEVVAQASSSDGLSRLLATAPTVLIIDNFEQVIDAASDLVALCEKCPDLTLVVTSRRSLRTPGEHVVTLAPLEATSPAGAGTAPGVQLLLERAGVDHAGPDDLDAASRIVCGVGGLPLGIELAAFRAQTLGIATAYELLVANLALDGLSMPTAAPARHRDLRQCLQWTYRDLDERARSVFCAIGAFAGTFDLAALRAVVGDERVAAVGLASLVEHHVVLRMPTDGDPARYTTIPTIREFARELLEASPSHAAAIRDAHANWYAAVARRIRRTFECEGPRGAVDALAREGENINRAIGTRVQQGDLATAAAISCDGAKIAAELGRESRVNWWFGELRRRAADHGVALPLEANVWVAYAELAARTPATATTALQSLDAAIAAAREAADDVAVLRGLDRLAISVIAHGDLGRALRASAEGVALADRLGLTWLTAQFAIWHAMLQHVVGNLPAASRFGFEALAIARQLGDGRLLARVGLLFAPMERTAEMDAQQVPDLPQCLELARDAGSVVDEMYVSMQLAIRAGFRHRDEVFELADRGLDLADRTRSHPAELVFVLALASAAFAAGDHDVAARLDRGLRTEWTVLSTVMPSGALERYEAIVSTHRSNDPEKLDAAFHAASAPTWLDVLETARAYVTPRRPVEQPPTRQQTPLTRRELEVLRLIATGRTNKEIAAVLGIQPKTVMHHCSTIFSKLHVKSRAEAAATAVRLGLAGQPG